MSGHSSTELLLRASCEDLEASIERLLQLSKGDVSKKSRRSLLARHFWFCKGSCETSLPKTPQQAEVERHTDAKRLRHSHDMGTFSGHLNDLDRNLHEQSIKIGTHLEGAVSPNAPSRCPGPGNTDFHLTELQRAAQRFFGPACPPPMRRIMTELTPGMGKTCIYMEVIAKFLGKRNPETGEFFDIIILGDDEVFAAFNKTRVCPAQVNLEEIVAWNVDVNNAFGKTDELVRRVIYKRDEPDAELPNNLVQNEKYLKLKNINTRGDNDLCILNTEMKIADTRKTKGKKGKLPKKEDIKHSPLEEKKSADMCKFDDMVWRGTRVIMIPYAVAAKWVVYSGHGIRPLKSPNGPFSDPTDEKAFVEFPKADVGAAPVTFKNKATEDKFQNEFGDFFTKKELGASKGGLMGSQTPSLNSDYRPPGLKFSSSNTLFIIDEVQNLSTPSKWGKGHHAAPFSPALSEALWRCTGDFCDETKDETCKEGRRMTPYIFAGTATPNTGTNPESTICLLQILNGKQRPHLFVPRWADGDGSQDDSYTTLKPRTLKDYRELLKDAKNRSSKILHWPPYSERKAKNLVVLPRSFLEEESKFVKDVTKGGSNSGAFPLLIPQVQRGRVIEWKYDKERYTYAGAAKKVLLEKLLPEDSEDVSEKGAYLDDRIVKRGDVLTHDLAYKGFICAARDKDLRFQYTRIYKPIYEDDLNRHFLQDMVATRVFTANSYFDYRVYPQVDPITMQGDIARPLTRLVIPKYAIRCLPQTQGGAPNLGKAEGMKLTPRMRAEKSYPRAKVKSGDTWQDQYPWQVPSDSAATFVKNLKEKPDPKGDLKDCRWSEWSLCADLDTMKKLCEDLYDSYRANVHDVNVELENRLRDFCARNCPKLVVAADDMYAYPPPESASFESEPNIFAPGLAAESKSFFFLNVSHRTGLNSNYFVVIASFYFRMRCRPYLQRLFEGHEKNLPPMYRNGKATIQHRIAWLDALLLNGGDYSWVKTRAAVEPASAEQRLEGSKDESLTPPDNKYGNPNDKSFPRFDKWKDFWLTWLKGYRLQRSSSKLDEIQNLRARLKRRPGAAKVRTVDIASSEHSSTPSAVSLAKKDPTKTKVFRGVLTKPIVAKFKKLQANRKKAIEKAKKDLVEEKESPEDEQDKAKMQKLEANIKQTTFFMRNKSLLGQRVGALRTNSEAFYMPAIFSVGDTANIDIARNQNLHHKLYCILSKKLKNPTDCKDTSDLSLLDVVDLIGSPGFREAMVKGMDSEPCVKSSRVFTAPFPRESPAGQSMIFAGLAAHKALDFKCTGLNVAFGPQPRGQRIQEMGRNWRSCVNIPFVAIRQLFLDGDEDVLKNDLLLDSFYLAQNEVLDWLRIITISAGLGCSLWWGYSQWAKLLSSYNDLRPSETDWFFGKGKSPCLDSRGGSHSGKVSLIDWYNNHGIELHEASSFYRCNRTNLTSKMTIEDSFRKDYGRIVRSLVGAFSPDEIVFDPKTNSNNVVPDPSCRKGTAVEVHKHANASVKYCLTMSEAAELDGKIPPRPHAPLLKTQHFMAPLNRHMQMRVAKMRQVQTPASNLAHIGGSHSHKNPADGSHAHSASSSSHNSSASSHSTHEDVFHHRQAHAVDRAPLPENERSIESSSSQHTAKSSLDPQESASDHRTAEHQDLSPLQSGGAHDAHEARLATGRLLQPGSTASAWSRPLESILKMLRKQTQPGDV